jgi:hypothetical protein
MLILVWGVRVKHTPRALGSRVSSANLCLHRSHDDPVATRVGHESVDQGDLALHRRTAQTGPTEDKDFQERAFYVALHGSDLLLALRVGVRKVLYADPKRNREIRSVNG